ncbi:diguanylate cyclase [Pseudomonas huanghezhanensis]|uniref:diguanylate cyclase n=1 Tax=Pseudomonas huanghezhanensis TaxID=3002903 RepID=UPI0022853D98|nr:diguanylate cyclase [Pseudomonas sp. BSw22131]
MQLEVLEQNCGQGEWQRSQDAAAAIGGDYGGEEIAVLLPNTDADGARVVVTQILDDIRVLNIIHDASPFNRVTLSAGVFVDSSPADDLLPALMIKTADAALYQAKRSGKDRWELVEKS